MTTPASIAPIRPEEVEVWRGHVGRQETRRQRLDIESLKRFAAAQGADMDVAREAPPLAHWAYFLDTAPPEGLGQDGHPRRGGLMPAVRLPRRMFASATMAFSHPLILDAPADLSIVVGDVTHKSGKTGDLVFVDVDRTVIQDGVRRLSEHQTIVYRGLGAATPAVIPADLPPHHDSETWKPGPVDLFRFSAVTFNSHRIHYDAP